MNKTLKACQHCKIYKSCQLFSHLKLIEATHPAELVDIGNDLDHICADLCRDNMTSDEAIRLVNNMLLSMDTVDNAKDLHFLTIKYAVTQQTFKKAYDALEKINLWSACLARLS